MEYVLVMALSGTTMTCLYLLARCLLRKKLSAGTYFLLAKAAVFYYLIPLPFVKNWYRELFSETTLVSRMGTERISLTWTKYLVHANGGLHANGYAVIQTGMAIVWMAGAVVLLIKQLIEYVRITHWFAGYAQIKMTDREKLFIDSLRREYGVRRRVSLIPALNGEPTITFGVFRPVILCGRDMESRETKLLVRHEMVHIKRGDVFWKILLEFTKLLHWWNPFLWKLRKDFEVVCECSCDEKVMRGKTESEVKTYLRLMIEEALDKKSNGPPVKWKAGFGNHIKEINERMENLMRKNKWNRYAAGVLAVVLIFANSMTVFAYRDPVSAVLPEEASEKEIAFVVDNDVVAFTPDSAGGNVMQVYDMADDYELHYENQFIDGEGNVFPVSEDDGIDPHCSHVYVWGEAGNHSTYSDGSCEVRVYRAERCARCGQIVYHEFLRSQTWAVCPH